MPLMVYQVSKTISKLCWSIIKFGTKTKPKKNKRKKNTYSSMCRKRANQIKKNIYRRNPHLNSIGILIPKLNYGLTVTFCTVAK